MLFILYIVEVDKYHHTQRMKNLMIMMEMYCVVKIV